MKLEFFKSESDHSVGVYTPSPEFSRHTHFCVMDEETNGLIASCGYFQPLDKVKKWGLSDYLDAAECIEQANLYCKSREMFGLLDKLLHSSHVDIEGMRSEVQALLESITDISEPAERLLGPNAMRIIEQAKREAGQ